MKNFFVAILCFFVSSFCGVASHAKRVSNVVQTSKTISLEGTWHFAIDRQDVGVKEQWFKHLPTETIHLPGSMPEMLKGDDVTTSTRWTGTLYDSSYYFSPYMEKYRKEGNIKLPFFLTPDKHYVGVAWYTREVQVPATWKGMDISLFLERPHVSTTVWVNGKMVGTQNSLCVPHVYSVTPQLHPGRCLIAIRVDNRMLDVNVGPDSHSVTDQTQGNWNGMVGRLQLQAKPKVHVADVQVYPQVESKCARVRMVLQGEGKVQVRLSAQSFNAERQHKVAPQQQTFALNHQSDTVEMMLPMGNDVLLWDEFHPNLYKLKVEAAVPDKKEADVQEVRFGMRQFTIQGKWFYVNGRRTMLRGTVENCDFPLTGYAPMDVDSWMRVFRICKSYGLNHMRFHSYCPPAAAFEAADCVGFYLQPEGPSWPNHGVKLGNGQPIDKYLMTETQRINQAYGNSPSFCMMACGNEPSGNWVAWVSKFVDYWKKTDPRHVYTGASVGGGWQWQPKSQYHVKAGARGLNWSKSRPQTMDTYSEKIDTVSQPYVSHETGQWCAFPNFDEIEKYTGVNKARNFEIFRDVLADNKMASLAHRFMMASGKLQALCYKYEIERTLRTPDYAGFQLLGLNDYSGQGTALVGVLDVFFDEKGYMDAPHWRRFCSPVVPLMRTSRFTYTTADTLKAAFELANWGENDLSSCQMAYVLKDADGSVLHRGELPSASVPCGGNTQLGALSLPLVSIVPTDGKARQLNLEVRVPGSDIVNDWNFWVYPAQLPVAEGDVYTTDSLDAKAIEVLQQGGKVLLTAAGKVKYGSDIRQQFTPVFWNTSWFKMRPPHTTGLYLNPSHPLFKHFPTSYYSDVQWWELANKTQVMQFTDFPDAFQPLVQSIDTWFLSRKIGMLFEAKVLNGRLMMTTMDITSRPDSRIVARQMRYAIYQYMNSPQFRPQFSVPLQCVQQLYTKQSKAVISFTKESPDELKPKLK